MTMILSSARIDFKNIYSKCLKPTYGINPRDFYNSLATWMPHDQFWLWGVIHRDSGESVAQPHHRLSDFVKLPLQHQWPWYLCPGKKHFWSLRWDLLKPVKKHRRFLASHLLSNNYGAGKAWCSINQKWTVVSRSSAPGNFDDGRQISRWANYELNC